MNTLHVVFRVGEGEYVVPALDVLQMESYTGSTLVPGAPPFVAGIIQVRGRVVPVVDLRARFGLPALAPTLSTRVVVVELGERTVALLVDSAREVLKLDPQKLVPPPNLLGGEGAGFVKAVAHEGKRLLMLIDFAKVIGEEIVHVS